MKTSYATQAGRSLLEQISDLKTTNHEQGFMSELLMNDKIYNELLDYDKCLPHSESGFDKWLGMRAYLAPYGLPYPGYRIEKTLVPLYR